MEGAKKIETPINNNIKSVILNPVVSSFINAPKKSITNTVKIEIVIALQTLK